MIKLHFLRSIILVLFLWPAFGSAQLQLSGTIINTKGEPIEFVNVIAADTVANILEGSITTASGVFSFELPEGNYVLTCSFVGFEDYSQNIDLKENLDLGNIQLNESATALDEVVVTSRRPTIVRKIDRLVFSIQNTTLSDSDAWEVLRKTPGVSANSDGTIQIHGKAGIVVMINERPVQLSSEDLKSMLEGMAANDIAAVEVITNPPAKYGADGAGILNIKMVKRKDMGYNINARSKFTQGQYSKLSNGFTSNYKGKSFDLLTSYNFDNGKWISLENSEINFFDADNKAASSWDEAASILTHYNTHNYRVTSNFYLSDKSTLGLQASGNISPDKRVDNAINTDIFGRNHEFNSVYINDNDIISDTRNTTYNLNFDQKLNKEGQSLKFDFDYTNYKEEEEQTVLTDFFDQDRVFLDTDKFVSTAERNINIYSSKVDFSTPLDSTSSLDMGAKFNAIKTDNDLDYSNVVNGEFINDPTRSNQFIYKERTAATYLSYNKSFSKLTLQLGMRGEYTVWEGNSLTLGQVNQTKQFQLFPSAFINYSAAPEHSLGFTYGRRISRPQFTLLNPFQFYYGPFSYIEGNPFLRPSIIHSYGLNYTLKNKYFFRFYLFDSNNPITQLSIQDNENQEFKYLAVNLDDRLMGGFTANTSVDFTPWWNAFMQMNYYYQRDDFQVPGTSIITQNSKWNNYALLMFNTFQLSKKQGLTMEFELFHLSSRIQGGFNLGAVSDISIGFKKKLFKNNGSVSIFISDLFNQYIQVIESEYVNQSHSLREKMENQRVRVAFNYNFGNQKIRLRSKSTSADKEKQRIEKR